MTDTTHTPGTLTKDDVARWLRAEADSYARDAQTAARSEDLDLRSLTGQYRTMAYVLNEAGRRFSEHGPLPPLDLERQSHQPSLAARCPVWPEGCGEPARYESLIGRGPVSVRHRKGCAVKAALEAELREEASRG